MQWKILYTSWCVSINLNKGPYSTCLNPHIGIFKTTFHKPFGWQGKRIKSWSYVRDHKGWFLEFKPHWIFNIELNRKQRKFKRIRKSKSRFQISLKQLIKIDFYPKFSFNVNYDFVKKELRIYLKLPFVEKTMGKYIKLAHNKGNPQRPV